MIVVRRTGFCPGTWAKIQCHFARWLPLSWLADQCVLGYQKRATFWHIHNVPPDYGQSFIRQTMVRNGSEVPLSWRLFVRQLSQDRRIEGQCQDAGIATCRRLFTYGLDKSVKFLRASVVLLRSWVCLNSSKMFVE